MKSEEITKEYLIKCKNKAEKSNIKYNPKDLENICTEPDGRVSCTNGRYLTLKEVLPLIPSAENVRGVLKPCVKLKTGYRTITKSKLGYMTTTNHKTILNLNDLPEHFNLNQVECLCLDYKCGGSRSKALPLGSVTVLYKGECCAHTFCIESYFPQYNKNKLFYIGVGDTTTTCKLNVYQKLQHSFSQLNNWSEDKIKGLLKRLEQLSKGEIKCYEIQKEFNCDRNFFLDLVMTYYYLTNKKHKFVTAKAQQQGIYVITPDILQYLSSLRNNSDLVLQSHIKIRDDITNSHKILLNTI